MYSNWDSLVVMIDKAELIPLFKGQDPNYKDITFFGITNHSIRRYMLDRGIASINNMSKEFCKKIIMLHILGERYMLEDINFRVPDETGDIIGATEVNSLGGVNLLFYKEKTSWEKIADAGPVKVYLFSNNALSQIPLASPNISTSTGVVHSLNYNYTLGDIVSNNELSEIEKL